MLRLFLAAVVRSELRLGSDHDLLRWLAADELDSLDWLPSDRLALAAVRAAMATAR